MRHEYEYEERWLAKTKRECFFGLSILIATGIGAALSGVGVAAATAATIGAVAAPAVLGAGVGALTAAVSGGKPLKGAGIGALGGLAVGGLGAAFPETMGALGMGPQGSGFLGTKPGGGALAQAGGAGGPGFNPLDLGIDDYSMGGAGKSGSGFLSEIGNVMGMSKGEGGKEGEGGGFNMGRGLMGLLGGALSAGGKPDYSGMPGKETTAGTLGPYFDKPLQSGYTNRTPVENYQPAGNDWYSYGSQAQPQFFNNNQLNLAHGGALSPERIRRPATAQRPATFDSAAGDRFVQGEGDGQSDSVDAKLSAGEYVWDAATVARLGNGSNEAGARKLDKMRARLARDTTGSSRVIPRKAKEPMSYLASGTRKARR